MRLIPITFLIGGMIVGRDILGKHGEIFLKRNTKLNRKYINRLTSLGYSGIYVEDDISEGIEIIDVVDEKIRLDTVAQVRNVYNVVSSNKESQYINWNEIDCLTSNIISQITSNTNIAYNMSYIKSYDDYTFSHCVNVALLSVLVGTQLEMRKTDLEDLFRSALLHDLGKVFLPLAIVNKPGKLTEYEYAKIKQHPLKGYKFLKQENYLSKKGCRGVLTHHERYDGKGYPMGYDKNNINLYGKILSICDVYDALTSDRPYRKAWSQLEAFEYITANSGHMFDPDITKIFLTKIKPYNPGTVLLLSNGFKAILVKNNLELPLRPEIRIFEKRGVRVDAFEVDLQNDNDYFNVTIEKEVNE